MRSLRALFAYTEPVPMHQLTLDLPDPDPVDYAIALHEWSKGRRRLPTQCQTIDRGARCRFTVNHHGACDPSVAPPINKSRPIWSIAWTDNHGRPRIIQVRRDRYPELRDVMAILSAAWSFQIKSVDEVTETYL